MKLSQIMVAAPLLALAAPLQAQVTTYSTTSSFSSAAGAVTTETFSSCTNGAILSTGQTVSSSSGACGSITPGITFAPTASGHFYIAGPGQSTNPTTALGVDIFNSDPISITFASDISAFGADLFQNFAGGSQSSGDVAYLITVFGPGNTLLGTFNPLVSPNGGDFFGLTSTSPISKINVSLPGGYAVIDNVRFAAFGAVPEPASWALMLLGFGAIGCALRRRSGGALARA